MTCNVLFLCTANACRSIMAEAMLNALGGGRFHGYSAGTRPAPGPDLLALEMLWRNGYPVPDARSKHWSEFIGRQAPRLDFVVTLGDSLAAEPLPEFRSEPICAHWGIDDPSRAQGSYDVRRESYLRVLGELRRRIQHLTSVPVESVGKLALRHELREIGLR